MFVLFDWFVFVENINIIIRKTMVKPVHDLGESRHLFLNYTIEKVSGYLLALLVKACKSMVITAYPIIV